MASLTIWSLVGRLVDVEETHYGLRGHPDVVGVVPMGCTTGFSCTHPPLEITTGSGGVSLDVYNQLVLILTLTAYADEPGFPSTTGSGWLTGHKASEVERPYPVLRQAFLQGACCLILYFH